MKSLPLRFYLAVAGLVVLISLLFATYTQHVWEDYWITFRSSRNLATGLGLVYAPGERLHTFTSPLGTLLPAAFSWLTGNQADNLVLWLFRCVSVIALAAGVALLFRVLRELQLKPFSCLLTVGLIGLDAKVVDFTINGMETGLLLFFLALTIHGLLVTGSSQVWRIGIGWAGLMWTRPDSCVYIAALAAGTLIFLSGNPTEPEKKRPWKMLLISGLVCAALYLPWFLWAWNYYGSPIPHTIVAKSTNTPPLSPMGLATGLLTFPFDLLTFNSSAFLTFLPSYSDHGGWDKSLVAISNVLALVSAFAWLLPVLRAQTRLFSLTYFLGNYYLTVVLNYYPPWYLPIVAVLGYLTLGLIFDQAIGFAPRLPELGWARGWVGHLKKILPVAAIVIMAGQAVVTVCVAWQLRTQQALIENGLRTPIGLWLREHAQTPRDTVMLEPLGYIGYYSGLKMLDYPGLSSTEMVKTRKQLGHDHENQTCHVLKPNWLVLRPNEAQFGLIVDAAEIREHYELAQVFDASEKIKAVGWLPGRPYLEYDQTFLVFHRKPESNDGVTK